VPWALDSEQLTTRDWVGNGLVRGPSGPLFKPPRDEIHHRGGGIGEYGRSGLPDLALSRVREIAPSGE
jgi:hypothetical protein